MGVFLYVFAGVGATVPYVVGNILGEPGLSSEYNLNHLYSYKILRLMYLRIALYTIGWAYAIGISLALTVSKSPTSYSMLYALH